MEISAVKDNELETNQQLFVINIKRKQTRKISAIKDSSTFMGLSLNDNALKSIEFV